MKVRQNLLIAVMALYSANVCAQSTPPPGPPWKQACRDIGKKSFRLAFTNTSSCGNMYLKFLEKAKVSSAVQTAEWMVGQKSCFPRRSLFPWLAFMSGDSKVAKIAWTYQMFLTNETTSFATSKRPVKKRFNSWLEAVRAQLTKGKTGTISEQSKIYTKHIYERALKSTSYKEQMDRAYAAVTPLCLYHKSLACRKSLKQGLDWMYPRSVGSTSLYPGLAGTFSMLPIYLKVFNDPKTMHYASAFAEYLLDFIASGKSQRIKIPEFYELGLRFFKNDTDRFWSYMSFLATRGSSFALMYPIAHADTQPLFASLMVVSASMSLLDTLWQPLGKSFSYAKTNRNTCFQGKPYHFWMSGSFSYLLNRAGHSKKASKLTARLLGAMYEMNSQTWGRDAKAVFFAKPFDSVVMGARREVVHQYLGSELGVRSSHAQNFDLFYKISLLNSKPIPKMSKSELLKKLKNPGAKWKLWTDLVGFYDLDKSIETDERYWVPSSRF